MKNQQFNYNVGVYLRISREDGDNKESESISNQRKIIKDFIEKNKNYKVYDEYIDDGYSGANFNRPDFKRLIDDIKKKKINMVITKNLARLGRNYIEVGNYIEKFFPNLGVRYIAVLDKVDNFSDTVSNDLVALKSVFNEKHCKDTSLAVKKSKRRRMKEGVYACNTAPFGYKKDPKNNGKLLVDEESSKTVKKIFELRLKGMKIREIVEYLDKNKYPTPIVYMKTKGLEKVEKKELWRRGSVTRILGNQVYLGHCLRGKTTKISYKTKSRNYVKRSDWILTKNTHEALVSEDDFNKIHNNNKYGMTIQKNNSDYLLKNFIYCRECGRKLNLKRERKRIYLVCSKHYQNSKLCSNNCKIEYNAIEKKIVKRINRIYLEYINGDDIIDKLCKSYAKKKINNFKIQYNEIEETLDKLKFRITSLYNQRLQDKIDENQYKEEYKKLSFKRNELIEKLEKEKLKINEEEKKIKSVNEKSKIIKRLKKFNLEKLNEEELKNIIERIEVYKNEINVEFLFTEIRN